jgi:hypothetical protein
MQARVASRRELQQALLSWLDAARKDDAVEQARVYEDVMLPGVFALEADMLTGAAVDVHVHSEAFAVLIGALNVLAEHVHLSVSQLTKDFGPGAFAAIRHVSLAENEGSMPHRF